MEQLRVLPAREQIEDFLGESAAEHRQPLRVGDTRVREAVHVNDYGYA